MTKSESSAINQGRFLADSAWPHHPGPPETVLTQLGVAVKPDDSPAAAASRLLGPEEKTVYWYPAVLARPEHREITRDLVLAHELFHVLEGRKAIPCFSEEVAHAFARRWMELAGKARD